MSSTGRKLDRRNEVGEEPVAKSRRTENVNSTSTNHINNNNHNNQNLINVQEILAAERARTQLNVTNMPNAAALVQAIDPRNNLTSSDFCFVGWRNGHIMDSITGIVAYSVRGPTLRRSFDRADVRLTIGYGNDQQSVGIYGYDFAAQMLENCVVNTLNKQATVQKWTGTVPFVLRYARTSSMVTVNNSNSGENNVIVPGTSGTSGNVGAVQTAGGGGNVSRGVAIDHPNVPNRRGENGKNNLVLIDMFEQQGKKKTSEESSRYASISYIRSFMSKRTLGNNIITLATTLLPHINNAIFDTRLPPEIQFNLTDLDDRWGDFDTETLEVRLHIEISSRRRLVGTLMHELSHYAVKELDHVIENHGPHWRSWIEIVKQVFPELGSEMLCECCDY